MTFAGCRTNRELVNRARAEQSPTESSAIAAFTAPPSSSVNTPVPANASRRDSASLREPNVLQQLRHHAATSVRVANVNFI